MIIIMRQQVVQILQNPESCHSISSIRKFFGLGHRARPIPQSRTGMGVTTVRQPRAMSPRHETHIEFPSGWQQKKHGGGGGRRFLTATPIRMGRRSSKIATKKTSQDKKKAKLYGRIGKAIVQAVKRGGPNPVSNPTLAAALEDAKERNVPREIVDRNVRKAADKSQQDMEELVYEIYGFGGTGIVAEAMTDNKNRAAAGVRDAVKKSGGKMAEKGSVLFRFRRAGVVRGAFAGADFAAAEHAAVDAGAEDVVEEGDARVRVVVPLEQYRAARQKLQEAGMAVDLDGSGAELVPWAVEVPGEEAEELNKALMEKLLDLDDVDLVSSTQG